MTQNEESFAHRLARQSDDAMEAQGCGRPNGTIRQPMERMHEEHVHVYCFVCGWAHVKGRDCEYACYA